SAGWQLYHGRTLALLGRSLARSDRDEAVDTVEAAVAVFAGCGALVRRGRTLELLSSLGARGRRVRIAVEGPDALTWRELEVARLAARGLTSTQIGQQLFIGRRTVETHLGRAYQKLGVKSRLELIRRAEEIGI